MRILFDKNVPAPLRRFVTDHQVEGTTKHGWARLKNGELLKAAEAEGFDILLTADQNLSYQQNLRNRKIALVVLGSNRWKIVRANADKIACAVNEIKPGAYIFVEMKGKDKAQ